MSETGRDPNKWPYCKHPGHEAFRDHVRCTTCFAIMTDGGWGIASRMWFRDVEQAKFYQKHGRLPDPIATEHSQSDVERCAVTDLATLGTAEGPAWRPIARRFTKDDLVKLLTEAQLDELGQWRTNFATYGGPWVATPRDGYLLACLRNDRPDKQIANARLMAAAPELARQCLAMLEASDLPADA